MHEMYKNHVILLRGLFDLQKFSKLDIYFVTFFYLTMLFSFK